jgi:hypothetical protein
MISESIFKSQDLISQENQKLMGLKDLLLSKMTKVEIDRVVV